MKMKRGKFLEGLQEGQLEGLVGEIMISCPFIYFSQVCFIYFYSTSADMTLC